MRNRGRWKFIYMCVCVCVIKVNVLIYTFLHVSTVLVPVLQESEQPARFWSFFSPPGCLAAGDVTGRTR